MRMIFHITIAEVLAFAGVLIAVIAPWIALRVKLQKIETTTNIKFLELEKMIMDSEKRHDEWVDGIKEMAKEFLTNNKEEHREIMHNVGSMRSSLEFIKIKLAEKGFNMHANQEQQ